MFIRGKRKSYNFVAVKWDGTTDALHEILELTGKKSILVDGRGDDYLCYDKQKGIISFYAPGFGYMAGIIGEMVIKSDNGKFNILPESVFNAHFDVEDKFPKYNRGEPVIYQNGDRFELGIIKDVCDNGVEYFVYYHTGDTASRTHARNLHKIENAYAFEIKRNEVDE